MHARALLAQDKENEASHRVAGELQAQVAVAKRIHIV